MTNYGRLASKKIKVNLRQTDIKLEINEPKSREEVTPFIIGQNHGQECNCITNTRLARNAELNP